MSEASLNHDADLRKHLVNVLTKAEAHADFDAAVKGLPAELQGKVPEGSGHSPWMLLEHLRITLWDILDFSRNPDYKEIKWPDAYWPSDPAPPNDKAWDEAVKAFKHDLKEMCDLVSDPKTDLFAKIPHGSGQTILREALLVADHNAYHVGQLILVRKMLGAWK